MAGAWLPDPQYSPIAVLVLLLLCSLWAPRFCLRGQAIFAGVVLQRVWFCAAACAPRSPAMEGSRDAAKELRGEAQVGAGRKRKREDDAGPAIRRTAGAEAATGRSRCWWTGAAPPRCRCGMRLSSPPPLQRLLQTCRAVFDGSGTPPTSAVVAVVRGLMEMIGPHDVGLTQELDFFHRMNAAARQNPPIITCKTIYDGSNFTVAVFFLPLRAVMPLHDHPGMTVFTKLLIGSARVEAYDWVRPGISGEGSAMLAEKVRDHDVTAASGAWALFPDTGGNMHRFSAGEEAHCAFLDVLTPPYAPAERRRCAYYKDVPCKLCPCAVSRSSRLTLTEEQRCRRQMAWLEEVAEPRSLRIVNLPYRGPTIF